MPIIKSAIKKLRQDKKRTARNKKVKKDLKEKIKKFSKEPSKKKLKDIYSTIDKAWKKGVIKKNKAARLKSRLSKKAIETKRDKKKK